MSLLISCLDRAAVEEVKEVSSIQQHDEHDKHNPALVGSTQVGLRVSHEWWTINPKLCPEFWCLYWTASWSWDQLMQFTHLIYWFLPCFCARRAKLLVLHGIAHTQQIMASFRSMYALHRFQYSMKTGEKLTFPEQHVLYSLHTKIKVLTGTILTSTVDLNNSNKMKSH